MASNITAEQQYQIAHIANSNVPRVIGTFVLSLFLAYTARILRMISRRLSKAGIGIDDWIIVASLPFTTGFVVVDIVLMHVGYRRHEMLMIDRVLEAKGVLACESLYTVSRAAFKISTLFLLRRIFPGRNFVRTLIAVGSFVLAYSITQILCAVLSCIPLSATWDPHVKGRCIDTDDVFLVCSSFNIVTDVIILGLPMPKLWKLKISKTQKAHLTFFLLLGGLVCIISIIRTITLKDFSHSDSSHSNYDCTIWSNLEMAIGTLSACLATLRPLYQRCFGRKPSKMAVAGRTSSDRYSKFPKPSGRERFIDTTIDAHSFTPLKDVAHEEGDWMPDVPLDGIRQGSVKGNAVPLNAIRVSTNIEQNASREVSRKGSNFDIYSAA